MVIYGWSTKALDSAPLNENACTNCESTNTHMSMYAHYFHVFWIPIFPFKKKVTIQCGDCGHEVKQKNMDDQYKNVAVEMKKRKPFPKYMFSGLAIIFILIGVVMFWSDMNASKEREYLTNPMAGDVYVLKDDNEPTEFKFYLWKVRTVTADSVFVSQNSLGYNMMISSFLEGDGFYDLEFGFGKDTLLVLKDNNELRDVMRDYTDLSGFNKELSFMELLMDSLGTDFLYDSLDIDTTFIESEESLVEEELQTVELQ